MRHFGQRVGLIHELRQLRRAEEFAHRGHRRLGVDEVVRHHRRHVDRRHPLLHGTLHAEQADAVLVLQQLAHRTHAAIAEIVDVVDLALAVLEVHERLDDLENILGAQRGDGILDVEVEPHVELDAADGGQVIAFRIEEQPGEQRFRGFLRGRLAGAHDAVDFGQRMIALLDLVGLERVADPRAGRHMVDIEQVEPLDAGGVEHFEILRRNLVTGLDVDAAGRLVDQVERAVAAEDLLGRDQQHLEPVLGRLVGGARADLGAGGEHGFAGLGVDDVERRLLAAPILDDIGHLPATLAADIGLRAVELVEDILVVHAERIEQRRHRQLALAVDTDVDDVLCVELEIEPRAAIGDHAGGEQELARCVRLTAIMIEQHARRTVHLADDHALGAVDDERAVRRHQRHVAHIDVLLLDIEHRAGFRVRIHFEHDQAQRHAHRRRIGDAALAALVGVELRLFQLVIHEIQLGGAGEIADREHAAQRLFQAGDIAVLGARAQEMLVAFALHLDQVRHLHDFVDVAEHLADALLRGTLRDGGNCLGRHGISFALCLRPRT